MPLRTWLDQPSRADGLVALVIGVPLALGFSLVTRVPFPRDWSGWAMLIMAGWFIGEVIIRVHRKSRERRP